MKKVFVWKSYGDVNVIDADSIEGLQSIYSAILLILDEVWDLGDELDKIKAYHATIEKNLIVHQKQMLVKVISALLNKAVIGSDESFEYGTGFTTLQSKV
jgi:hypothetical protein